jgi:hypothetical protein
LSLCFWRGELDKRVRHLQCERCRFATRLRGYSVRAMPEATVKVEEVKALRTQSGKTRFVLVDDSGKEYTTFKEPIAREAIAAEGRRARIEFHEQERNGFHNVYLDAVVALEGEAGGERHDADEVAWKTAIEAAPWLLGEAPEGGVDPEEAFEKLRPFKELVAEDIADDAGAEE